MQQAYVELEVPGMEIRRVLSTRGEEALSTLFRYEVQAEIGLPIPDADTIIGTAATLTLCDRAKVTRTVTGVVAEASLRALDNQRGRATVIIRPNIWRQTLGRDCYASQDVTVVDVVDDVLADFPDPYRWELVRSYPKYPYRSQYREDDWTYVSRFLEEEGIYYYFDHEAGSTLVFCDDSTAAPDIEGGAILPWVRESAMLPELDAVTQLGPAGVAVPGRFTVRSFDLQRPTVQLENSDGGGKHEIYDAPGGGSPDESVLAARMSDQREAAAAAGAGVKGLAMSARPYPGRAFTVEGHPSDSLNARVLVTKITVEGDFHKPVSTTFAAIPAGTPYRPPRDTPRAKQAGLQMGKVVGLEGEEVHPDELARVRVILHWDRLGPHNEQGGTWMRVAQRQTPGSMLFPRMGWNVATFNEEGGVDAPSVIWRIHDGEKPPEYSLPGNMTRVVFKTDTVPADGTSNEIYFEDKAGAEEMFIHASRDMSYRIRDAKWETVRQDSLRVVGNQHQLDVGGSLQERVQGDQTISIGSCEKLEVMGHRVKTVSGNETETVGGSRTLKVGDSHLLSVNKNRDLSVGPAMIELTLGSISMAARDAVTLVGGAVAKLSTESISETAGLLSAQLIGGAKVELAKTNRTLDVTKTYQETVGGAIVLQSNAKYTDNADTIATWQVGALLDAQAPEVHIEANEKIQVKCGDSVLTIDQESIKLNATKLNLSAAHLDADTGAIEHN